MRNLFCKNALFSIPKNTKANKKKYYLLTCSIILTICNTVTFFVSL